MLEQEKVHLSTFEKLIPEHRVRPTILLPLWNVAGFALGTFFRSEIKFHVHCIFVRCFLGAGSALLGKEGAMACTVAVETAIGQHYDAWVDHTLHYKLYKLHAATSGAIDMYFGVADRFENWLLTVKTVQRNTVTSSRHDCLWYCYHPRFMKRNKQLK